MRQPQHVAEITFDRAADGITRQSVLSSQFPSLGRATRAYDALVVVFAVILVLAAALKVQSLVWGNDYTGAAKPPQLWSWMAAGLELGLAAWLLSGWAAGWARRAALSLLIVFSVVSGSRLLTGAGDCGCFGAMRVHPAYSLTLDLTCLLGIWLLGRSSFEVSENFSVSTGASEDRPAPRVGWFAFSLCVLVPSVAVPAIARLVAASGDRRQIILLDAQSSLGKPFPLLPFLDEPSRADLATGRRTVILFSHDCDDCRRYLARLPRFGNGSSEVAICAIDLAPFNSGGLGVGRPDLRQVRLRNGVQCFSKVPLKLSLSDGIVQAAETPDK
jgi:hypothetical protein